MLSLIITGSLVCSLVRDALNRRAGAADRAWLARCKAQDEARAQARPLPPLVGSLCQWADRAPTATASRLWLRAAGRALLAH